MNENTTYLIHRKGEERADHKYYRRELVNGKWRYYYKETNSDRLFDSMKTITDKDGSKHIKPQKGKISQTLDKWKSLIDDIAWDMKVAKIKATDKGQSVVNNLLNGVREATGAAAKEDMARQKQIMENASSRKKDALTKHKENVAKIEPSKAHQSAMEKAYGKFNKKVINMETQAAQIRSKLEDPNTSVNDKVKAVKDALDMTKTYDNYKRSRDNAKSEVEKAKTKTAEYSGNVDFYKDKANDARDSFVNASLKYYESKSIYDKSLVGRIDQASEWLENLFKKRK